MSTRPERRRTIRIRVDGRLVVVSESLDNPLTLFDVGMGGFSVMSPVQISMSGVLGWRISRSSVARKRVRLSSSGLASGSNPM